MTTEPLNLYHLAIQPRAPAERRSPTIIMLHGRGVDENDLARLAPRLDPRLLIISLRAPYKLPYGGYTWFDLKEGIGPDPTMFQKSLTKLLKILDILPRLYPIDKQQIYLFGFSMGAAMAYALTLTAPEKVAGVIAHSGYLPENSGLTLQGKQFAHLRFYIAHGTSDQAMPITLAQRAREVLQPIAAEVSYHEYATGHQITAQSIDEASAWLSDHLRYA